MLQKANMGIILKSKEEIEAMRIAGHLAGDVLKMIRDTGGIVMATFVPWFISARVMEHRAGRLGWEARLMEMHPDNAERRERELVISRKVIATFDAARGVVTAAGRDQQCPGHEEESSTHDLATIAAPRRVPKRARHYGC